MFKRFLVLLLLLSSFTFAQRSTQVWKYKDGNRNTWDNWNESGTYYEVHSYKADSLTSFLFSPKVSKYYGFNGVLGLAVQIDTLTDATIATNGSFSFKLHLNDGISWQEENGKIKWWLATDSSSTTYTLGDAQSGLKYYYLTDPSNDGIENLPVSLFRVEMFWSDSVRASVKMTWFGY